MPTSCKQYEASQKQNKRETKRDEIRAHLVVTSGFNSTPAFTLRKMEVNQEQVWTQPAKGPFALFVNVSVALSSYA